MELEALNAVVADVKAKGAQLFAVSPQTVENNRATVEKLKIDFEILSDLNNSYAEKLDIAHGFQDDLKEVYGKFGIDVAAANGTPEWRLPIPTQIVVGADHKIVSIEYDSNYINRPEPSELPAKIPG